MRPFLSGYTGDPINFKRRLAPQATRGLPATTGYRDGYSFGGPVLISPATIARQVVLSGGEPAKRLPGKANLGGGPFVLGDVDPGNYFLLLALANVFGKYSVTEVETGRYRWRFSLDEATAASPYLSLVDFNDVTPQTRFHDLLMGGFGLAASPGENFAIEFPFVVGGYSRAGDPVQETGAASTLPVLRKTWPGNWSADDDQDIWVKVLTDNADGTWEVQVGLGSSTVEPTFDDTRTLTEGQWFRLFDTDGSRIGVKAEQPEIYLPVGATLAELDVFRFPRQQTIISPSLGTSRAISSVNTSAILDGEEIRVEGGWSIEAAWETLEGRPDTAGRQSATVRRAGELGATVTPTRDLADLTLQYALDQAETVSWVVDAETDVEIGSTGSPYRVIVALPSCQPEGDEFSVEPGATNRDESLALVAGVPDAALVYDGISFGSHLEVLVENDIASL